MTRRRTAGHFLRPALFAVALAGGAAAAGDKPALVTNASVPRGTDVRIKRALSDAVKAQLTEANLGSELRGYSIAPALIRLRSIAPRKPAQREGGEPPSTECVVELSLEHVERGLVAHVRGSATGYGATQVDTVQAAAEAAVARLPEVLTALSE